MPLTLGGSGRDTLDPEPRSLWCPGPQTLPGDAPDPALLRGPRPFLGMLPLRCPGAQTLPGDAPDPLRCPGPQIRTGDAASPALPRGPRSFLRMLPLRCPGPQIGTGGSPDPAPPPSRGPRSFLRIRRLRCPGPQTLPGGSPVPALLGGHHRLPFLCPRPVPPAFGHLLGLAPFWYSGPRPRRSRAPVSGLCQSLSKGLCYACS